jgi:predicted regulator of Ras-like GTPase activity (Roadblock/LC7/MglB family)
MTPLHLQLNVPMRILETLRSDASASLAVIIDIEALPIFTSPSGSDASVISGRWAALMQSLAPVCQKAASGPMEELVISGTEGEVIASRLGDSHWLLLVVDDKSMLGRAKYAIAESKSLLQRKL